MCCLPLPQALPALWVQLLSLTCFYRGAGLGFLPENIHAKAASAHWKAFAASHLGKSMANSFSSCFELQH